MFDEGAQLYLLQLGEEIAELRAACYLLSFITEDIVGDFIQLTSQRLVSYLLIQSVLIIRIVIWLALSKLFGGLLIMSMIRAPAGTFYYSLSKCCYYLMSSIVQLLINITCRLALLHNTRGYLVIIKLQLSVKMTYSLFIRLLVIQLLNQLSR